MTLYAAYGSHLDPRRMAERAPASPVHTTGWLRGWRLTFAGEDLDWDGPFTTVVEDPGSSVFVLVYELAPDDERALEAWESAEPDVRRKVRVRIEALVGDLIAWIYVLDAYEGGFPSATYLASIADAAEAGGAPSDYLVDLRTLPCRSDSP